MKKNSQMETLAVEVIRFLQKWGLWEGTSIFTDGNRFAYTADRQKNYKGINNVEFSKNIDPEEYMTGLIGSDDPEEGNKKMCLANPEHIFDMTYEGALYMLLKHDEYEVRKADIGEKAWKYIFEHTDILNDLLYEKYECQNADDLYKVLMEDVFENPKYSAWDPLVFDTWEEYQEFINGEAYPDGEEKKFPNYLRYETYGDYLKFLDKIENLQVKHIVPLWNSMVNTAKKEFIEDCGPDGNMKINIPEIAGYVYSQFRDIFSRYGLWYEFEFDWSLSCYRESVKEYVMFIEKYKVEPGHNMNLIHNFIEAWGMTNEGEVIEFTDECAIRFYARNSGRETGEDWSEFHSMHTTSGYAVIQTDVEVRPAYVDMFRSFSKRGRSKQKVMELMAEKIRLKGGE